MYQSPEEAYRKGVEAGEQMLAKKISDIQKAQALYSDPPCCCNDHGLFTVEVSGKSGFSDYKTLDDDWGIVEGDDVIPFKQDTAALQARLLLIGNRHNPGIIVPNHREWVGFNVLERDGQLEALKPLAKVKR